MSFTADIARALSRSNRSGIEAAYRSIRQSADNSIKAAIENGSHYAEIFIPPFLFYHSAYDQEEMSRLVSRRLQRDGFVVTPGGSVDKIYVQWHPTTRPRPQNDSVKKIRRMNRQIKVNKEAGLYGRRP